MTYAMPHDPDRKGKRQRERRTKSVPQRWEWVYKGRAVIVVEMTSNGEPVVIDKVPKFRVDEVSREIAAAWLNALMPRKTNNECYEILWG